MAEHADAPAADRGAALKSRRGTVSAQPIGHETADQPDHQRALDVIARVLDLSAKFGAAGGRTTGAAGVTLAAKVARETRLFLTAALFESLCEADRDKFLRAAEADGQRERAESSADDGEAERMLRQFGEHCARSSYRPPRLSREERRRAANIRLEDTPRARLAEAWEQASERDRRDFVRRVLGREAA